MCHFWIEKYRSLRYLKGRERQSKNYYYANILPINILMWIFKFESRIINYPFVFNFPGSFNIALAHIRMTYANTTKF